MAALDDPDKRTELLDAVGRCGSVQGAAQMIHLGRRSINAYLKTHPDLAEAVKVERLKHKKVAHHAPRIMRSSEVVTPEIVSDGPVLSKRVEIDTDRLLDVLWAHAENPDSRASGKCCGILSELGFGREMLRMRAEAKRLEQASETDGSKRPLIVRVPASLPPAPAVD